MFKTRVGVVRGGPSAEYEVSLQTGSSILHNLPEEFEGVDIFIDKKGQWYRSGLPITQYQALRNIDVVWNALHGFYGEDGKIQQHLESIGVPYTGSSVFCSLLAIDKSLAKDRFRDLGVRTPKSTLLSVSDHLHDDLFHIFESFPLPAIVKPVNSGSSLGVTLARSFDDIEKGVRRAFLYSPRVLVEEYISGTEGTVGTIEKYRGENIYALSPVEIVPTEKEFFDYDGKYKGRAMQFSPSRFTNQEIARARAVAQALHKGFDIRHYSRMDFIISPERGMYVLEVNTLPALFPESSFERSLKTGNIPVSEFVGHILHLALEKN